MKTVEKKLLSLSDRDKITLTPIERDAQHAICANRAACFWANAIDRQMELDGHGYVRCDAHEFSFTLGDHRFTFHPPKAALNVLRKFDEIGSDQAFGSKAERTRLAREYLLKNLKPVKLTFLKRRKKAEPGTRERKDQINAARNKRNAERRLRGEKLVRRPRYASI